MAEFVVGAGVSFIRSRLIVSVGEGNTKIVDKILSEDTTIAEISRFFQADGPRRLIFMYQVRNSCLDTITDLCSGRARIKVDRQCKPRKHIRTLSMMCCIVTLRNFCPSTR